MCRLSGNKFSLTIAKVLHLVLVALLVLYLIP